MGVILDIINDVMNDKDEDVIYEEVYEFLDGIIKNKKFDDAMKGVEKEPE